MKFKTQQLADIILGMREAYSNGENAMEWCREYFRTANAVLDGNDILATLVAYDLQAGSYVSAARAHREKNERWCQQLAGLLRSVLTDGDSILEVGVGEATTLTGVLQNLNGAVGKAFGFDVSWSRVAVGRSWLEENSQKAKLFVADLLNIPLEDNSVDVVYSSHSLEPNRGRELAAIGECLRVARKSVVLVEPIYELASAKAQARMRHHRYVEGLRETAEKLGARVRDYRLLEYAPNPLNPSGVLCLEKSGWEAGTGEQSHSEPWLCPITAAYLENDGEFFFAFEVGLAYPVLRGIPLLRAEHAIVASKLRSGVNE